ncbi:MAG: hypothetical protein GY768_07115 [Planctomycetaceae bacterium]|nr:hypothetical protein [Planctomycetaceae bacterium]
MHKRVFQLLTCFIATACPGGDAAWGETSANLSALRDKLLFESYTNENWDIWQIHPDGTGRTNITQTNDIHELYPQASPDGTKICFLVDEGSGRNTSRSLWVMNRDGSDRRKLADGARHACWSPDSQQIAFAKQEFPKFNIKDYVTKYLYFHHLKDGRTRVHPNKKIEHIYVPTWSANEDWIIATVHGGMGFGHAIVGIEVNGDRIVDLKISGCRPTLSPDGKRLTWSSNDHTINVADITYTDQGPQVSNSRIVYHHDKMHLYHPEFSPDGKFITFSYGPGGRVASKGPGTHAEVAEMVGVCGNWDIYIKEFDQPGEPTRVTQSPEKSNKESDWIRTN